jgi:sensor c-di-GMP phosphodiesterase-like protein
VALAVGCVAFVAPIWISVNLAWNQAVANEKETGLRYAQDVMRRSEDTADQFGKAIRRLNTDHLARCSPEEIELMRQIDIGSSHLQMIARISGTVIECTSLGTTHPIDVGKPTIITEHRTQEWTRIEFGAKQPDQLGLLARDGVAVLIDSSMILDIQTEGKDVGLALIVPSSTDHVRIVQSGSTLPPHWFRPAPRGSAISFMDDGYMVSQVRSTKLDLAAVSVMPRFDAYTHVRHFVAIFVPIGLLCGCGLAWAVMYVARTRSSLPALLRTAARRRHFYVEYQPVVETATGRCVGAEALVRWKLDGTVISPGHFVPLAEESGLITQVTENVIAIVARDLPRLLQIDPDFRVAINLSATDLRSMGTIAMLKDLLHSSGAHPRNIVIEATEHGFLQGPHSREVISGIRSLGFEVAIDDFGTGYSSLSCLQNLDLDVLKIDKAFVDTIGTDGVTSQVVLHIISMAHSLRMCMIAEGVETESQARFLQSRGVEFAQGWLFGKPLGIDVLCRQLNEVNEAPQSLELAVPLPDWAAV